MPTMPTLKPIIQLLRFPFSLLLMPIFGLALSQATFINWHTTAISFLILHLLVYPSSNAYNSLQDKDEGSIGGLEKPPPPPPALFGITLVLDAIAIVIGAYAVHSLFALLVAIYILISRAYSYRGIRLKKYPLLGFLTVVIVQGAFTYVMAAVGISGSPAFGIREAVYILCAASLQIAGVYPLTQIYQHESDRRDGVHTLSAWVGYRGTFVLSALCFLLCNVGYYLHFSTHGTLWEFYVLQLFFIPVVGYFSYWAQKVWRSVQFADFRHTMRMNLIAALCMNLCFIFITLLKHFNISF